MKFLFDFEIGILIFKFYVLKVLLFFNDQSSGWDRHRETHREAHREAHRETHRETQRERERERQRHILNVLICWNKVLFFST